MSAGESVCKETQLSQDGDRYTEDGGREKREEKEEEEEEEENEIKEKGEVEEKEEKREEKREGITSGKEKLKQNFEGEQQGEYNYEGDEEEEEMDPRIQIELDRLNEASEEINKYENELDEARAKHRTTLSESSQELKALSKNMRKTISRARTYYELKSASKRAQEETIRAAGLYQSANSIYRAAKETIMLAEEKLTHEGQTAELSAAWQEMLNHATIRVVEAEKEKRKSEEEHHRTAKTFADLELQLHMNEKQYPKSIEKARPYFEKKAEMEQELECQKQNVIILQNRLQQAKTVYSGALKNLEVISEELHEKRKLKALLRYPREPGVGAESENSKCINLTETNLDYLTFPSLATESDGEYSSEASYDEGFNKIQSDLIENEKMPNSQGPNSKDSDLQISEEMVIIPGCSLSEEPKTQQICPSGTSSLSASMPKLEAPVVEVDEPADFRSSKATKTFTTKSENLLAKSAVSGEGCRKEVAENTKRETQPSGNDLESSESSRLTMQQRHDSKSQLVEPTKEITKSLSKEALRRNQSEKENSQETQICLETRQWSENEGGFSELNPYTIEHQPQVQETQICLQTPPCSDNEGGFSELNPNKTEHQSQVQQQNVWTEINLSEKDFTSVSLTSDPSQCLDAVSPSSNRTLSSSSSFSSSFSASFTSCPTRVSSSHSPVSPNRSSLVGSPVDHSKTRSFSAPFPEDRSVEGCVDVSGLAGKSKKNQREKTPIKIFTAFKEKFFSKPIVKSGASIERQDTSEEDISI